MEWLPPARGGGASGSGGESSGGFIAGALAAMDSQPKPEAWQKGRSRGKMERAQRSAGCLLGASQMSCKAMASVNNQGINNIQTKGSVDDDKRCRE